MQNLKVNNLKI